MNFHWQNLNEKGADRTGSPLRHGRAWLSISKIGFNWEWGFLRHQCVGISVAARQDENVGFGFSVGVPFLFSLYLTVWGGWFASLSLWLLRASGAGYNDREVSLRFHDAAVWWEVWRDSDSWSSDTPRYRSGCFHIDDFVLGKAEYSQRILNEQAVQIALPEASYPATVKIDERTWKRPRWFTKRLVGSQVDIPKGIPFPGKGENSWDCGQDAVFGLSSLESTVEGAIAAVVRSVLKSRRRHGGSIEWKPEMAAAE
jgi:hypothetical protein